jgi:L-alanine-DL-glutamate epimerase-like enolase superfamily enzyme
MDLAIDRIDRHPVELPFREIPRRNMDRELPHWRYFEVVEVELSDGTVGHGETMLFYTWGRTEDRDAERARGGDAVSLMWDDSLGPGLQTALFDAVGRALDVPAHALLGSRGREEAPISWWCIDMPPEDWVAEAELARERGYTDMKLKGRPWFDIRDQLDALDRVLPPSFEIDVDFNATVLDADRGVPLLEELDQYPQVSAFEGPIPRADHEGNRRLREAVEADVVHHYADPVEMVGEGVCDGFVVSGGATAMRNTAGALADADGGRPFWVQRVGTGITAAFSVQFGAVAETAAWPAVTCHQLYEHDLLVDGLDVSGGTAAVPDRPGLGVEVDTDAIEEYACEKPASQPYPRRLVECRWPDGPVLYLVGNDDQVLDAARDGVMPYFERGPTAELRPDDGSEEWEQVYRAALDGPVEREEPI